MYIPTISSVHEHVYNIQTIKICANDEWFHNLYLDKIKDPSKNNMSLLNTALKLVIKSCKLLKIILYIVCCRMSSRPVHMCRW